LTEEKNQGQIAGTQVPRKPYDMKTEEQAENGRGDEKAKKRGGGLVLIRSQATGASVQRRQKKKS